MIELATALKTAADYIAAQPAPSPGYRYVHGPAQEVTNGWYFDHCIECDLNIPESEREMFGGAPGFLVSRETGYVSIVTWDQLHSLGLPK